MFTRRSAGRDSGRFCSRSCGHAWQAEDRRNKAQARNDDLAKRRKASALQKSLELTLQMVAREAHHILRPCIVCQRPVGRSPSISQFGRPKKWRSRECRKRDAEQRIRKRVEKAKRRARLRGVAISRVVPKEVFERDNYICHICSYPTDKSKEGTNHRLAPSLDHITPLARGGSHDNDNVACAHRICNSLKGSN